MSGTCLCTGSSRAKAPLGTQCFTELWCQRAGYSPDTTPLTRAARRAGRDGSLSLRSCPWGRRVPSLPGHQRCPLCRGVMEGDDDTASSLAAFVSLHSLFTDFTFWPDTLFPSTLSQLLFIPHCREPGLCSESIWVELFLKANSLSPHVPVAEGASRMKFLTSQSPCKHELFRAVLCRSFPSI